MALSTVLLNNCSNEAMAMGLEEIVMVKDSAVSSKHLHKDH